VRERAFLASLVKMHVGPLNARCALPPLRLLGAGMVLRSAPHLPRTTECSAARTFKHARGSCDYFLGKDSKEHVNWNETGSVSIKFYANALARVVSTGVLSEKCTGRRKSLLRYVNSHYKADLIRLG
jgi:hypothetical protein